MESVAIAARRAESFPCQLESAPKVWLCTRDQSFLCGAMKSHTVAWNRFLTGPRTAENSRRRNHMGMSQHRRLLAPLALVGVAGLALAGCSGGPGASSGGGGAGEGSPVTAQVGGSRCREKG